MDESPGGRGRVGRAVAYSNLAEVKQRLGALPEAAR
jgi:hypothetical protein